MTREQKRNGTPWVARRPWWDVHTGSATPGVTRRQWWDKDVPWSVELDDLNGPSAIDQTDPTDLDDVSRMGDEFSDELAQQWDQLSFGDRAGRLAAAHAKGALSHAGRTAGRTLRGLAVGKGPRITKAQQRQRSRNRRRQRRRAGWRLALRRMFGGWSL